MRFFTPFCAALVALTLNAKAQDSPNKYTVKGVVSYFYNTNYGDKPDTGAKAYVLTDGDMKTLNTSYEQIYRYLISYLRAENAALESKSATLARARARGKEKAEADKAIENANQKLAEQVAINKSVGDSVSKAVFRLEMSTWDSKRVTSDGNGVFTKKVVPGKYYVLVISAHRQHTTVTEVSGQIAVKKAEVKDDDVEIPFKFGL